MRTLLDVADGVIVAVSAVFAYVEDTDVVGVDVEAKTICNKFPIVSIWFAKAKLTPG